MKTLTQTEMQHVQGGVNWILVVDFVRDILSLISSWLKKSEE